MKKTLKKPDLSHTGMWIDRMIPHRFFQEIHLAWYPDSEYLRGYARVPRGSHFIDVSLYIAGVNELEMLNILEDIALTFHLKPDMRYSDAVRYAMRDHKHPFIIGNFNPEDLSQERHNDE